MITRPPITTGLRPMLSTSRPESCKVPAVPTAASSSTTPATPVASYNATANWGNTATRTPKLHHPLAKAEASAAR